jgi:hypothetical protein
VKINILHSEPPTFRHPPPFAPGVSSHENEYNT